MNRKYTRFTAAILGAGLTAVTALAVGDKIVIDGSTTVGPIAKAFAEYYMGKNPSVNISVSESGSGNGAKSLVNNACDVATMSRPMKAKEKKAAEGAGILPVEHIVAMDGIAVIVHPSNPVADLTVDKLRAIYTGTVKNWKELGGPDADIVVISRDTNSGTYETFETLVMKKEKMAGKTEYVGSNGASRQRVTTTPAAIAYVGLAFTEGVKAITVDQVVANHETVLNGKYVLARPLYMYTNGRVSDTTHVGRFLNLYRTAEGRRMIEDVGYVPLKN
ncbi:MAG: phosphate-binding protein [Lentisphaerae bacterium RIFOXYC12_FULL_60_16]|nr:MAG: phosphate-binding protein [Lentisphaerae bacterium RIFOXYC12_FULL_60_16]